MTGSVFIGPEVDPAQMAPDVILHPGCRISGAKTSIGPGCEIGAEGPVTLVDCQLGRNVKLNGGFFSKSVFLDGASMGSGAHVREGTILEEEANGAHTVGLKQTVLLPFVTLGSLINFCDVLMAGGISRREHSEVGSSYIHFNFTPHQDKATASLLGDVPRGVLLNQKPIFLGGQGGLAGPARVEYGCVIAAGGVCRKDVLEKNSLCVPAVPPEQTVPYDQGVYKNIDRIVGNSLAYIGNIRALKAWYSAVRVQFIRDEFDRACFEGVLANLDLILKERVQRLEQLAGKMKYSFQTLGKSGGDGAKFAGRQKKFYEEWKTIRAALELPLGAAPAGNLMRELAFADKTRYIQTVQNLSEDSRSAVTSWLQAIVDESEKLWD